MDLIMRKAPASGQRAAQPTNVVKCGRRLTIGHDKEGVFHRDANPDIISLARERFDDRSEYAEDEAFGPA